MRDTMSELHQAMCAAWTHPWHDGLLPTESDSIDPDSLVGRRVEGVTASWSSHVSGTRDLIHAWLRVAGLGEVRIHTLNGIQLDLSEVYAPYDMPELGTHVVLEAWTPAQLGGLVGQVIEQVQRLRVEGYGFQIGIALVTDMSAVAIVDVGDDLVIGSWPESQHWSALGVDLDEP
jgi:hypothetical protein